MTPAPGEAPNRRNNTTILIVVLAVIAVGGCGLIAVLAAVLFPVFAQAKDAAKMAASLSNIKQLGVAMQIYATDFDDRFPPAKGWGDRIAKYVTSDRVWHDPLLAPASEQRYGYAMNAAASAVPLNDVVAPDKAVLLFSTTVNGPNAVGTQTELRVNSRRRFLVGFADGSAKRITVGPPESLDWDFKHTQAK